MTARIDIPPLDVAVGARRMLEHSVGPDDVDVNGHLDVRGYVDLHLLGCERYFADLGLGDDYRRRTGLTVFSLSHSIAYVAEVHLGERVDVHVQVTSTTDTVVRGWSVLVKRSGPTVSSVCHFVDAGAGLSSRRLEPFAEPLLGALRTAAVDRQTDT